MTHVHGCARWCVVHFPSYLGEPMDYMSWNDAVKDAKRRPWSYETRIIDRVTGVHFLRSDGFGAEPTKDKLEMEQKKLKEFVARWGGLK